MTTGVEIVMQSNFNKTEHISYMYMIKISCVFVYFSHRISNECNVSVKCIFNMLDVYFLATQST